MNRRDSLCTMATCVVSPSFLLNMTVPKPKCVPQVDLRRYMGDWFEIGRYPNPWQKDYVAVKTNYRLRKDGKIDFDAMLDWLRGHVGFRHHGKVIPRNVVYIDFGVFPLFTYKCFPDYKGTL